MGALNSHCWTCNGFALRYAPTFQDDEDVVMEAVKQSGMALKLAAADLQANKDIVMEAVK